MRTQASRGTGCVKFCYDARARRQPSSATPKGVVLRVVEECPTLDALSSDPRDRGHIRTLT